MPKDASKPPPGTGKSSPDFEQLTQKFLQRTKSLEAGLPLDVAIAMLRQADERPKALIQAITGLEHRMHIMMGLTIVVVGLVLSSDAVTATGDGGWAPLWVWQLLLSLLAATAFYSLFYLGRGLFKYTEIALVGTDPEVLNAIQNASEMARGVICHSLITQYECRIEKCETTYNKKRGLYKSGRRWNYVFWILLMLVIFMRIWV